jgi:hypothetical protein
MSQISRCLLALDRCAWFAVDHQGGPARSGIAVAARRMWLICAQHFTHVLPHGPQLADAPLTDFLIARGEENQLPAATNDQADYRRFDRPGRRKPVARGDQ